MSEALKISIVTPAYNSAATIERTIRSVLEQKYPNLEYIVIDGSSRDNTPNIIKEYADQLHYWISEPDHGMYDALQKGFAQASGDVFGWLNSDDMHNSDMLETVNHIFSDLPQVEWITTLFPLLRNPDGHIVDKISIPAFDKRAFFRGEYSTVSPFVLDHIQQESTFWRHSLWEKAGARVDTSLKLAGDFELWARFFQYADLVGVRTSIGSIVNHPDQMTKRHLDQRIAEEHIVLERYHANVHNRFSASIRHFVAGLPPRLKRIATRFGYAYQTQIAVYDFDNARWKLKARYF